MKLLAIETSSDVGTVALQVGDDLEQRRIATPREQTEQILPIVDALLSDAGLALADLDGITFGRGPGSFTGLRVAAAVAQGLGLAANLPLLPVSSLAAMAQGAWRKYGQARSLVCTDARMAEVFWGAFEIRGEVAAPFGEEHLSVPDAVDWPDTGEWGAVGSGFEVYSKLLSKITEHASSVRPEHRPSAVDLLPAAQSLRTRGEFSSPADAVPTYLRGQSAWSK